MIRAQLKDWIAQALKGTTVRGTPTDDKLLATVKAAVREELEGIAKAKQATNEEAKFVKNMATGVVHLATKQGSDLSRWSAKCGWKLAGSSNAAFLSVPEAPRLYKLVCEKCMPLERASHKLALNWTEGSQCGRP